MSQCVFPDCAEQAVVNSNYCQLHQGNRASRFVRSLTPTGGFGSIYGYIKDDKASRNWAVPLTVVVLMVIAYVVMLLLEN